MRSIYTSTRSLFSNTATRDLGDDGSGKRKKKVKKNAVMDHTEPQAFQRVVHLNSSSKRGDPSAPHESNCSDAIIYVVVPFVKQVIPLFFSSATKLQRHSTQQQQSQQPNQPQAASRHELKQITWKNFALEQATVENQLNSEPAAVAKANLVDLVAWKQGNCLVIYPDDPSISGGENEKATMSESARLRQQRERKSAVVALFDALEPLVQALMISRT